ncbi:MAG: carbohydrate ABC transporter permease, partial [Methylobacteriaceae bacterium]|nr:carbohydrate ABC transporter permease [Methylobacteriaceae bacterium]
MSDQVSRAAVAAPEVLADHSEGMSYLERTPRRLVTLWLPLLLIIFVLLFPFYWMALT